MVKFFRKIRQKLLSENKFSKYLIYAIGEIVLVVIGILIALQINNWNENRKTQKSEIKLLEQLNTDLKENLKEIFEIKSILKQVEENSQILLLFLSTNDGNTDSIPVWLNRIDRNPIFNNANTAYRNLENSSNKIISNDSLRLRITLMYEKEFRNIDVRENGFKGYMYPEFKKHQRENFTMTSEVSEVGKERIFKYDKPKDIKSLKENDNFKNSLVDMYDFTNKRIEFLTITENSLQLLIKDIGQEIEKLK